MFECECAPKGVVELFPCVFANTNVSVNQHHVKKDKDAAGEIDVHSLDELHITGEGPRTSEIHIFYTQTPQSNYELK